MRTHRLPERVLEIQNSIENQKNLKQGLKIDKGANLGLAGLNVEMEKEIYNSGVSRNEIVKDTVSFISILEIYDGKELASK